MISSITYSGIFWFEDCGLDMPPNNSSTSYWDCDWNYVVFADKSRICNRFHYYWKHPALIRRVMIYDAIQALFLISKTRKQEQNNCNKIKWPRLHGPLVFQTSTRSCLLRDKIIIFMKFFHSLWFCTSTPKNMRLLALYLGPIPPITYFRCQQVPVEDVNENLFQF